MIKNAFIAAVLLSALNAQAADLSYTYLDVGLGVIEVEDEGETYDGDGVALGGSIAAGEVFYFTAGLANADIENVEQRTTSLGVGVHAPLSTNTDVYVDVSYVRADIEEGNWSIDDNGVGYTLGIRSKLAEKFELGGGVSRLDVFDSAENSYFVNGFFYPTETLGIGAEYSWADDTTAYSLGLRVNF